MKAQEIDGWMEGKALDWLAEQAARHQTIVELGVWKGRSTACLAEHTAGTVFAIDHFHGSRKGRSTVHSQATTTEGRAELIAETTANLKEFIDAGKLYLIEQSGDVAATILQDVLRHRPADMVFIDADHDYEAISGDIRTYRPLLRPGGLLCGHDVGWEGVDRAINELLPGWKRAPDCCVWYLTV